MKTKIISKLKKEILVIEFPEGYELAGVTNGAIYYYDNQMNYEDYPLSILVEGSYTLLGKPDEIKEEDVRDLVESWEPLDSKVWIYNNYSEGGVEFKTAIESFNSALESEIFWENPEPKLSDFEYFLPSINEGVKLQKKFDETQENTFDKKRTLILVKN